MSSVVLGFALQPILVDLDKLLPSKKMAPNIQASHKYRQIKASIEEIGLIEPLAVIPAQATSAQHAVLDGHVRWSILRELGATSALCLVAVDDEAYTYNKRINRLSSIQEHLMIRRAIERGVSRDRLAKALNVDPTQIDKKANLLNGICPESVELLKDRVFSPDLSRMLRRMRPTRQVECVELMISANNLTVPYAEALLAATSNELLVTGKKPANIKGVGPTQMARMEHEMATLQGRYREVEHAYGEDVLSLMVSRAFLLKLLGNERVARFLQQHYRDLADQFSEITATTSLDR
jgi:hypothetical protein